MYHLELRQFPHVARIFNLEREELDARFVIPWLRGSLIEHDDRRWAPERSHLTILEGRQLGPEELGMGRGWASARKSCADVTEAVLAQARRGSQARTDLDALKAAIEEVTAGAIGFQDVIALAAAGHPSWRASEQLALAEQAVWEMLHQERLEMICDGEPVARDGWQPIVLSWGAWVADASAPGEIALVRPSAP
ncbi:MAG: hypothetical protein ACRDMX_11020 [Solirubrobacteraceae bacterium]